MGKKVINQKQKLATKQTNQKKHKTLHFLHQALGFPSFSRIRKSTFKLQALLNREVIIQGSLYLDIVIL